MSATAPASEGAILFAARHRDEPLPPGRHDELICRLVAWREILSRLGLVGRDPALYDGFAYGNVSARVGPPSAPRGRRSFLVSGTQTSGKPCLGRDDFCLVERYDAAANAVDSRGAVLPSSESMTHGAVYDLGPHVRVVFHVHCPTLWQRRRELRLPTSRADVGYGTPEMAREVERLHRETALGSRQIFAMGGHEDGLVAFGRDCDDAGQVVLRALARAYESDCAARGIACRG